MTRNVKDMKKFLFWLWQEKKIKIKIYHANTNQKKDEVAILVSEKLVFRSKNITGDEETDFIIIKKWIYQADITILNVYASITISGYFNTSL